MNRAQGTISSSLDSRFWADSFRAHDVELYSGDDQYLYRLWPVRIGQSAAGAPAKIRYGRL